jgi:anti-sigma factor RsiW
MSCKQVRELLWALLEGTVGQGDRSALEDHLRTCPACRGERAAAERTLAAMRGLPRIEPAADFQARLWRRVDDWETGRVPLWRVALGFAQRNRRVLATSLVAFAVALVGGLYVINGVLEPGGQPGAQIAERRAASGYEGVGLNAARSVAVSQPEVKPDYVLREIPYSAPLATLSRGDVRDTVYTRYPTRDLTPPGGLPMPTYVYEPVVTPVTGTEPVF